MIHQLWERWSAWREFRTARDTLRESGFFDDEFYEIAYPDVKQARLEPLCHFLRFGAVEGRKPNRKFDTKLYLEDFAEHLSGINPLLHYVQQNPMATKCEYPLLKPAALDLDIEQVREAFDISSSCALQVFFASQQKLVFPRTTNPEVSILIALHNRCELTYQCLQSLLASCQAPFEVVLVDNASSDITSQLLQRCENLKVIKNESNAGFVRAMNQAASVASGEYLLLLNNDTQLLGSPVDDALKLLRSDSNIGVAGGRILLPNATLQEAGCILRSNGSAVGYGRGAEPDHFEYMFRRDVDFCSGAFFMTPRSLFEEVGGLDERFSPAYCEEVDYCIQLVKQGKRIVYDPSLTIMHYEFASSTSKFAAIELQKKNTKQLYEKHRDWFEDRQHQSTESTLFTRTPHTGKRVLMIDDRIPVQSDGAGAPRARAIVQSMHRAGCFVTLLPTVHSGVSWDKVHSEIPPEVEVAIGVDRYQICSFLKQRAGYYDIVFVSRPHNMQLILEAMGEDRKILGDAALVYDAEAVYALRDISKQEICGDGLAPETQRQMIDAERVLATRADLILTVSAREAEQLRAEDQKTLTLSHAICADPTPNDFTGRCGVLFVGLLSDVESPNADSMRWFSNSVLPEMEQPENSRPPVSVCGSCHPALASELAARGLETLGCVEDLTPLYDKARVFIAPTRFAAGIPLKILEAAAHGVPVVATSILARQLGWQNDVELLVADSPSGFANAITRLHEDEVLWNRLRQAALEAVSRDCSMSRFDESIAAILATSKDAT